jgi:ubiquinone/menaquinone biosynthesis C-methylase UbiE
MSLAQEYKRQYAWRDWVTVLDALPPLKGQMIFDLGCGPGDLAAALVARGAHVVGFDLSEELLREARSQNSRQTEFHAADLRSFPDPGRSADGIWCSFAAAYFPDLPAVLATWTRSLQPGGWIAVTEIDNLFGHEPIAGQTKALLSAYAAEAFAAGRYDFHMGHKLKGHLEHCGFEVIKLLTLRDQELSFNGPAAGDVLDAWRARFKRMKGLHDFCGSRAAQVQEDFLHGLMQADHQSSAKVICGIATKKGRIVTRCPADL